MEKIEGGFDAGVDAGGLRNGYEVSILICYVLSNLQEPLTMEELQYICLKDGLVNYFELSNSMSELERSGQVNAHLDDGKVIYHLTEKGENRTEILVGDLPKSIRERALSSAMQLKARKKRMEQNQTQVTKMEDGYQVELRILDVGSDLLDLKLFVPNTESAHRVQSNFLNNPHLLYQGIWALLTGDYKTMGKLVPPENEEIPPLFD